MTLPEDPDRGYDQVTDHERRLTSYLYVQMSGFARGAGMDDVAEKLIRMASRAKEGMEIPEVPVTDRNRHVLNAAREVVGVLTGNTTEPIEIPICSPQEVYVQPGFVMNFQLHYDTPDAMSTTARVNDVLAILGSGEDRLDVKATRSRLQMAMPYTTRFDRLRVIVGTDPETNRRAMHAEILPPIAGLKRGSRR